MSWPGSGDRSDDRGPFSRSISGVLACIRNHNFSLAGPLRTLCHRARDRGDTAMKLGFFTMPIHPLEKDWRQALAEDREAFVLATNSASSRPMSASTSPTEAEKHHLEHHVPRLDRHRDEADPPGNGHGQPAQSSSRCAGGQRRHARPHAGRQVHPRHQSGRAAVGCELFGNLDANRNEMFLECINHVLDIWTRKPPYDLKGKYWTISTRGTLVDEIGQATFPVRFSAPIPPSS